MKLYDVRLWHFCGCRDGNVSRLVGLSPPAEISLQLLDGMPGEVVHIHDPQRMSPIDFGDPL